MVGVKGFAHYGLNLLACVRPPALSAAAIPGCSSDIKSVLAPLQILSPGRSPTQRTGFSHGWEENISDPLFLP